MKKRIAILGSTGSIGTQTLEVVDAHPELFQVEVLTAMNNADLLIQQALKYNPNAVVIANDAKYAEVFNALSNTDIKVFSGESSLIDIVEMESIDIVMMALVGYSGLKPTYNAILHKKAIALSNKEVLVVAGELITALAFENKVPIFPVDSEHSAIFQCLAGEFHNPIEKLILTASGGPFRGKSAAFLQSVTVEQALNHPNWSMGNKVTIDSASLMNKGLEVIEAHWLFQVPVENIEVLVHPQSIIHSMIQFCDGSVKAQLGVPDMKLPIMYSLSYPNRLPSPYPRLNFEDYASFTFEKPDRSAFRNLDIAYKAIASGGNTPCVMNAANEIAVAAFLNKQIGFHQLPDIIEHSIQKMSYIHKPTMNDYFETDKETRIIANKLINQ